MCWILPFLILLDQEEEVDGREQGTSLRHENQATGQGEAHAQEAITREQEVNNLEQYRSK